MFTAFSWKYRPTKIQKESESIWPLRRNLTALLRAHRVCTDSFLPKICWTVFPISQPVGGQQTGPAPPGGERNLFLSGFLLSTSHTGWLWFRRPFPRLCQPSWFVCRIWFIAAFSFSEGENLLRAIYSASERRLGTELFVCLLAIWSPLLRMLPFGITVKAAIKGPLL